MIKSLVLIILITFISVACSSNDTFLKEKKYDQFIKVCKKDATKAEVVKCYKKVADSYYYQDEKFDLARKYYSTLYANDKIMYRKATLKLANQYFNDNKLEKYVILSEEVEDANKAYLRVGNLYFVKKEYRKSAEYYLKIPDKEKIEKIAFIYSEQKKYYRAEYYYRLINRLSQKYESLANGFYEERDYSKSAELFSKLRLKKKAEDSYRKLGFYYIKNEKRVLKTVDSPITSIVTDKDYVYFSTLKGDIYRIKIFTNRVTKLNSLNTKIFQLEFNEVKYSLIARCKDKLVEINLDTFEKQTIKGSFSTFKISPNGEYIVFADRYGKITVINFENKEVVATIKGDNHIVNDMILTNELMITASDDRLIKTYALTTGSKLYFLRGHYGNVLKLALTKNQKFLVSVGEDKKIVIWDLTKERKSKMITSLATITNLLLSKDFSKIITAKSNGVDIWNFNAKREKVLNSDNPIYSILMLEDDYTLLWGDNKGNLVLSIIDKSIASEEAFTRADLPKEELLELAEDFFKEKKYEEMIKYYELANVAEEGYLKLGDFYYENEEYEKALKYYAIITQNDVSNKMAESYFKLGEYDKSYQYFSKSNNNVGLLKTAKMYNFEGNYYMSLTLYISLVEKFKENGELEKEKAVYYKIAELFMTMKESKEYRGDVVSPDEKLKIEKKLKYWYKNRYALSESYFKKAEYLEDGIKKIANHLCSEENFELAIEYFDKIKLKSDTDDCVLKAAEFNLQKVKELYQKERDKTDKEEIEKNKKEILMYIENAKKYYKRLKNKRILRKIELIKNKINNS